jgi:hypothetical protein
MQAPLVFRAILGLLMDLAIPASLGAFVMAGMRLRSEGGMNFEASGGFLKWLLWGCFLLSLPGVSQWLVQESVPGAQQLSIAGANGAQYTAGIERVTKDFVQFPRWACSTGSRSFAGVQSSSRYEPGI